MTAKQPNLGIAVLENGIIQQSAEPGQKRSRKTTKSEHWLGLYQLLQSDGQTDAIAGLQLESVFRHSDQVLRAVQMEARGDFSGAATVYGQLRDADEEDDSSSGVLFESHIRCLDELGRWDVSIYEGLQENYWHPLGVLYSGWNKTFHSWQSKRGKTELAEKERK